MDETHLHNLVSGIDSFLLLHGMVSIGVWRLLDSALGGASGRARVFLRWETDDMASCMSPPEEFPEEVGASCILDFVQPEELVAGLEVSGQSSFRACEPVHVHFGTRY